MIKVSVVVPVYNPGRYIEPCISSVLRQSLSPEAYEVIFVDDGSTDDTPARLDQLADTYPQIRVRHQENSGWPGKPRNVGIDLARGDFVFFMDQDDELAPEALDRMYEFACRHNADILLPKVAGTTVGPNPVFPGNIARCSIVDGPLIESLAPHKLFRRSFLLENRLRFPEGRRRLEDAQFIVEAYLATDRVSILADYPAYYWQRRDDGGNSSGLPCDLRGYFGNLRQVIETLLAGTEPGEVQNRLLARFWRRELLARLKEPRILGYSDRYRQRAFETVRELALDVLERTGIDGLTPITRLRIELLRAGRLDGLVELARRCDQIRPQAELEGLRWRDGELEVELTAWPVHADGSPVIVVERDGRRLLDPALVDGVPGLDDGWEVGDPTVEAEASVRVRDAGSGVWWFAPGEFRFELRPHRHNGDASRWQPVMTGLARLDPLTLAGGSSLRPGRCVVRMFFQTLGVGRHARLALAPAAELVPPPPAVIGAGPRMVAARLAPGGDLVLDVIAGGQPAGRQLPGPLRMKLVEVIRRPSVRRRALRLIETFPPVEAPARRLHDWLTG